MLKEEYILTKEYYLGLDVGTNSVGWAVTDSQYNLCKFKKKDMWGIRLFESAKTAEKRRLQRGNNESIYYKKFFLLKSVKLILPSL